MQLTFQQYYSIVFNGIIVTLQITFNMTNNCKEFNLLFEDR